MSRRHAAGAESARGLLFTVLGEFVLPWRGAAWTSSFIEVFGRIGVEEKAIRQALMRTAADGWLKAERVGRRTLWHLTPAAERLLTEGTERIYSFTAAMPEWDGRWLLVLARAPETDRPARHLLRTRLSWAGFGSPAPGVWVSTHLDRVPDAESALGEAGLSADAHIFIAEHHPGQPGSRLETMVRQAWDLDALEDRYEAFIGEFGGSENGTADPLVRVVELVHAWRRFPWTDPGLPVTLLPGHWSGVEAARLFTTLHARWSADAAAEWRLVDQRSSPRTGSGSVPALCSSTRHPERPVPISDHEQFDSGPSAPHRCSGNPSNRAMPSLIAAPWLTTTASPPAGRSSAIRSSAPATRPAITVPVSPPGGDQAACSAGYRSRISMSVSPSHSPPWRSRRSLSRETGRPVSRPSGSAVSAARRRSEETIAAGSSAARSRAARRACSSPVRSSGISLCP